MASETLKLGNAEKLKQGFAWNATLSAFHHFEKMRILHVIPSLSSVHGGPSTALPLMERALLAAGVEAETITTDDDGPGRRNGRVLGQALKENGVIRRYFAKRFEFYKVSPGLGRWARREVKNYDVVHVHALFSHTSLAAARAARAAGVPYVIRPLGVLNRYGMTRRRALLKKLSFRWLEGPLLRDAAAVHFTSEAEREEAEGLGVPMRSVVVPLGLELPEGGTGPEEREPVVLYLSRIDPKKNLEGLLRAWGGLAAEFPKWRLAVAGDGEADHVRWLRAMAEELGLGDRVKWLGRIEGGVKQQWLRESGVYVLPSFSENFGIAAVEAMGAGLPCLLGEGVAVAQDAAKAGGCILTAPDEESIRSKLRMLLSDAARRHETGAAAREFAVKEYGLEGMGRRLFELYARILERPGEI